MLHDYPRRTFLIGRFLRSERHFGGSWDRGEERRSVESVEVVEERYPRGDDVTSSKYLRSSRGEAARADWRQFCVPWLKEVAGSLHY